MSRKKTAKEKARKQEQQEAIAEVTPQSPSESMPEVATIAISKRQKLSWTQEHGQILKSRRTSLRLSLEDVARSVGVTASRIREVEMASHNGNSTGPSLPLFERLTDFFHNGKAEELAANKKTRTLVEVDPI